MYLDPKTAVILSIVGGAWGVRFDEWARLHFSDFHYFIDVIPLWNSLSSNVINSSAVSLFKKQIRCVSVR